jgi:hypothetical protein
VDETGHAERQSAHIHGAPNAFVFNSTHPKGHEIPLLRAKTRSRPGGHSEPIGLVEDKALTRDVLVALQSCASNFLPDPVHRERRSDRGFDLCAWSMKAC